MVQDDQAALEAALLELERANERAQLQLDLMIAEEKRRMEEEQS